MLVLASGYLSYRSLSSIVTSIHKATVRDQKLSLIKSIATNLEQGEQSIRLFSFSKDKKDLQPYQQFLVTIDSNLEALREAGKDNPQLLLNIDTISILIDDKIEVWSEILSLNNAHFANQYLDSISNQLEQKVLNDSLRKNRSVIKKIFKRQKKIDLDEEKMISDIKQIKEEREEHVAKIIRKEKQLAANNSLITERLYSLIKKMEDEEKNKLKIKLASADDLAFQTYLWIGWIAISGTISALLVIFVLSRYLKRSSAYQKALIASKKEAESLARTKERFIANVSHEIRTPMGIIAGFVDQLIKKPLEKSTKNKLKIIKSSSDHLVNIINDILDFSKLESGKMKLFSKHFQIDKVIDEIKLLFESNAAENNIRFEISKNISLPSVLFGDQLRLKQIMINLIGNAIKFTHKGEVQVFLSAENFSANNFDLVLRVEDTGIGIDSNDLDLIFQDFIQTEDINSNNSGTGLGLSIVKHLIDLHKGTIDVQSQKNKGTVFTCLIPYQIGDASKTEQIILSKTKVPDFLSNLKFLCVDDEPYNRKLCQLILEKWQLSCGEATNGLEAIEKIKTINYDVVLMDVRMTGMDGFETTKYIREKLRLSPDDVKIVLITATTFSEKVTNELIKQGINGYLPKPFTEGQLLHLLNSIFDRKTEQDSENTKKNVKKPEQKHEAKHIDLAELYRIAENDEIFVSEMLVKFIESFESGMKKIDEAIQEEDREKIAEMVHKLESPCRHIGAYNLLDFLKKMETVVKKFNKLSEIKDYFISIKAEFSEVKREIEKNLFEISNK